MSENTVVEKWVVTTTVHFGFVKETFPKGEVLTVNREMSEFVTEDGRKFQGLKDIDICAKNHFVKPYDMTDVQILKEEQQTLVDQKESQKPKTNNTMKVIRSDQDLMEKSIDIAWTKKKASKEIKETKGKDLKVLRSSDNEKVRGLDVVRSVETVEDYQEVHNIAEQSGGNIEVAKTTAVQSSPETKAEIIARKAGRKAEIEKNRQNVQEETESKKRGRPKGSKNKSSQSK